MDCFERTKTKYHNSKTFVKVLILIGMIIIITMTIGIVTIIIKESSFSNFMKDFLNSLSNPLQRDLPIIFLGDFFRENVQNYSQTICLGIEPLFTVCVFGLTGLINALLGLPVDMEVSAMSNPFILIVMGGIVLLAKLLLSFDFTRRAVLVTYGEMERLIGYIFMVFISIRGIFRMNYLWEKNRTSIEEYYGNENLCILAYIVLMMGSVFVALIMLLTYYLIKTAVTGLQVMHLSISFIPFSSILVEGMKSLFIIFLSLFNISFPSIGLIFNLAIIVVCLYNYKKLRTRAGFYQAIYLNPLRVHLLKKIRNQKSVLTNLSGDIKRTFGKEKSRIHMAIPVYIQRTIELGNMKLKQYEKWWMIESENKLLLCRKSFFSEHMIKVNIKMKEREVFFKKSLRYLELFTLDGPKENITKLFRRPQKEIHVVISREFEELYDQIIEHSGGIDYRGLKEKMLLEEKEHRKYIEIQMQDKIQTTMQSEEEFFEPRAI